MYEMKTEIDAALAQEKLDKVLEALYTAQINVLGLDASTIAATAQTDAIREVLVSKGLCSNADLLNLTAIRIVGRMEEMVDNGILDEEVLYFQTAEEDDALEAV